MADQNDESLKSQNENDSTANVNSITVEMKGGSRKLDLMERMLFEFSEEDGSVTLPIVVESQCPMTEELLRSAAILLKRRHPLLRSRVVSEIDEATGKTELFFKDDVNVDQVELRVVDEVDWDETQVADGKLKFDIVNGDLWRLWLLKSIEIPAEERKFGHPFRTNLVLGMHHGIMDGNTAMRLIDDLLTFLEMVQNKSDELPKVESLPMIPGTYDMLDLHIPWYKTYKLLTMGLKGLAVPNRNPYVEYHKDDLESRKGLESETRIYPMILSPELTSQVISASKKNGVTVHATITAASTTAAIKFIYGENVRPGKTYTLNTWCNVNFRRYLDPDPGTKHVCACFGNLEFPVKAKLVSDAVAFWKLAKTCQRTVHYLVDNEVLEFSKIFNFLLRLGFNPTKAMVKAMLKMPYGLMKTVFSISNMGRCDFVSREGGRSFELAEVYMCVQTKSFYPLFTNNIFTFHGQIYWSLVYFNRVTSKERAKEYGALLVECLEMACTDASAE
ncbi:uncharacterized protein LOC144354871 [Saccoglossus kowalevskii]